MSKRKERREKERQRKEGRKEKILIDCWECVS